MAIGWSIAWRRQIRTDDDFRRAAMPANGTVVAILDRYRAGDPSLIAVSYRFEARDRRGEVDLDVATDRSYEVGAQVPLLVEPAHPNRPRLPEHVAGAVARDDRNLLIAASLSLPWARAFISSRATAATHDGQARKSEPSECERERNASEAVSLVADSGREASPPLRVVAQYAAIMGMMIGIAAGLVAGGLISIDYVRWRSVPVEQVRVIAQQISATKRVACGRSIWANTRAQVTTFMVINPRPGLPGTFTLTECGIDPGPGDITTVQRQADDPEDVMLGPKITAGYVGLFSGAFFAVGFGLAFVWWMGVGLFVPRFHRWVAAGQLGPSDPT